MIRSISLILFLLGNFLAISQSEILNEGDSLLANGNYSKAISVYLDYNKPSEIYAKIAKANVAVGNYDQALQYFKLYIEENPADALSKYEYTKLLLKTKNFEEAIQNLSQLLKVNNKNPDYHYLMGLAMEKTEDSMAIAQFQRTFDFDQNHQKALFKLAKHELIKRQHEASHFYIDKGLEAYPENLELISLKAQNYYHQQYYNEAKLWFKKLVDLGESSEFIHEKLSMLYSEFGEWDKAIEERKKALKYNPLNARGIFVLGTYYEGLQNYQQAELYYKKALQLQDQPLDYEYQKLGYVLNRQQKHPEAIAAYQKAVKENPDDYAARFYVLTSKDAYYADVDAKIELYKDYIKNAPDNHFSIHFANRRLQELKEEKFTSEADSTQQAKN